MAGDDDGLDQDDRDRIAERQDYQEPYRDSTDRDELDQPHREQGVMGTDASDEPRRQGDYEPNHPDDEYGEAREYAETAGGTTEDEGGGWGRAKLGLVLLAAGVVLLLFPEPITSGVGLLLILVGGVLLLADRLG